MKYTQVELALDNQREVFWIPVPEGKAKVGEIITRTTHDWSCAPTESNEIKEDWKIIQVCTTLPENSIPKDAKIARNFKRISSTVATMSI